MDLLSYATVEDVPVTDTAPVGIRQKPKTEKSQQGVYTVVAKRVLETKTPKESFGAATSLLFYLCKDYPNANRLFSKIARNELFEIDENLRPPLLERSSLDTCASHMFLFVTIPPFVESTTLLSPPESTASSSTIEVATRDTPKRHISLNDALKLEEQIYQNLQKEIEAGRQAEALYWQFLNEDSVED